MSESLPQKPAKTVYRATGRRKEAIARVRIIQGGKGITINGRASTEYMRRANLQVLIEQPLKQAQLLDQFEVRANVRGGGLAGQAGAIRLGIARALLAHDEKFRQAFRRGGFLTRDPREKERKKFGHKGARKSFQYTKR